MKFCCFILGIAPVCLGLIISAQQCVAQICSSTTNATKFDCYPGYNATQDECEARGCCWDPIPDQYITGPHRPDFPQSRYPIHVGIPACYYPSDFPGYHYVNTSTTNYGYVAYLKRDQPSPYPKDIGNVRIDVYLETKYRLRIKISDADNVRYEVPIPQVPPAGEAVLDTDYNFAFKSDVGFSISRKDTGEVLFDASVGSFMFSDQFIQLSALLPTDHLYGLGQHNDNFSRSFDWQLIPLFASLLYPDYGSHPFYLSMEKSHQSHGVFLFNSNAMDILLQPAPAITYRVIGGILDFYFFLGPTPTNVIQQYTEVIGRTTMPPYWALGFHLCRYNYNSVNKTRETWKRNVDAGIPFDVQWNDIDYMDNYKDFTYNTETYDTLPEFVDELHANDMRYIAIIDSGVYVQPDGAYSSYDEGVEMDIFVKNLEGSYAMGRVWPDVAVFTDFTHPNAYSYWKNQYDKFHSMIPYDGAWIDMDEPTTFTAGSLDNTCPNTTYDYPPYVPDVEGNELFNSTICMSSQHYGGVHYDLHNLYGFMKTINTNKAMKEILKKRPFVMSRSTFPGQGHFGTHWTGDIYSAWEDLQQSIPGILNFNMYGVSMVGADICGFRDNTTLELCQRWTELGAFYPFTRNHNENTTIEQDPAAMGEDMVNVAINVLTLRYTLLPFLYTQFYHSHAHGETVVRPLFFEFPEDENTYSIQDQFLWNRHLMVLPVLEEGAAQLNAYFPNDTWYLWPNVSTLTSTGERFVLNVPVDKILLAIRSHSIIPTQQPNQTTNASRKNKFGLLVALDINGEAEGNLFWDDGETIDTIENGQYNLINFAAEQNSVTSSIEQFDYQGDSEMLLGSISVFGLATPPTNVIVNSENSAFMYDPQTQVLSLEGLSVRLSEPFVVTWT